LGINEGERLLRLACVGILKRVLEAEVDHFAVVFIKNLVIFLDLLSEFGVGISHYSARVSF